MSPRQIEDTYPLSPLQAGMLFHHLYAPRTGVDVEQIVAVLREDIDVPAFQVAWDKAAARHAVLRTSFRWGGSPLPRQDVHRQVNVPWLREDWGGRPPREQKARLETFLRQDQQRSFDLRQAPLLRLALFRFGPSDYRFVWTFHHAILDGRSFPIILREVFGSYEALRVGRPFDLPTPVPYRGYIEFLEGLDLSRARDFWEKTLAGFREPTPLTVGRRRGDQWAHSGSRATAQLYVSAAATSGLEALASENRWTMNTVVQAAWGLLLGRYSGEGDVVFGTTRACRRIPVEGAESMVGLLINTIPMRLRPMPEISVRQFLEATRAQQLAVRQYEHTPLLQIQQWSETPRGVPLFESLIVFENYVLNSSLRAEGGSWLNRHFHMIGQTNYPLTLGVYRAPELWLKVEFDPALFDDRAVDRMLVHLRTLLESLPGSLDRPLRDLPMLPETERRQVLVDWNATQREAPRPAVHEAFDAQVERTPDALALISDPDRLTYRELKSRADGVADRLARMGVGPGSFVGIWAERSAAMVAGVLGILKTGAAYVPLDPRSPRERLAFILEDAGASLLVTGPRHVEETRGLPARAVVADSPADSAASRPRSRSQERFHPDALAYVIYTSGSTGRPKGVEVSHRALSSFTAAACEAYGFSREDIVLQFASLSFDAAAEEIFPCLSRGGTVALRPDGMTDSARAFVERCLDWRISVVPLPTAYWHELVAALREEGRELPESVRLVIIGGERAFPEKWKAWPAVKKRARLVNSYGPTETTVTATVCELEDRKSSGARTVPIGRPISNVQIRVLDRHLNLVPIGVPGEIFIGGSNLAQGYRRLPALTAESFLPDPFASDSGARMYRTGDRGRIREDGNLEFLGRTDDQVKIRGFRIETGEITSALMQHGSVRQAAVIPREEASGDESLVAYVVPAQIGRLEIRDLRRHLGEKLPDYMVPKAFVLVRSLPLTSAGKLDRRALPKPISERQDVVETFTAARTRTEEKLVEIWEEVLNVERLGVHDNFFELGGHSLSATRLLSRVRDAFGIDLPLRTIFEGPTIARLAAALENAGQLAGPVRAGVPSILALKRRRVAAGSEGFGNDEES